MLINVIVRKFAGTERNDHFYNSACMVSAYKCHSCSRPVLSNVLSSGKVGFYVSVFVFNF